MEIKKNIEIDNRFFIIRNSNIVGKHYYDLRLQVATVNLICHTLLSFSILWYAMVSNSSLFTITNAIKFVCSDMRNYKKGLNDMVCFSLLNNKIWTKTPPYTCTEESRLFRRKITKSQNLPQMCSMKIYF